MSWRLRTDLRRAGRSLCLRRAALPSAAAAAALLVAQLPGALTAHSADPLPQGGISLTPAVVMLEGREGQGHRQTLSLTNHTDSPLTFDLVAQDVVAEGDRRVFLTAGQRPDSVAATVVFSPRRITIPPGETGSADLTVTVPPGTAVRAIAAIFSGTTPHRDVASGFVMTASLGTLLTFTLSDALRLDGNDLEVAPQTAAANLRVSTLASNTGAEPVVASGVVAILNDAGELVGRVPVTAHRLLPGERAALAAEYPALLRPGRYRAVLSVAYGTRLLTRSAEFDVSPAPARLAGSD